MRCTITTKMNPVVLWTLLTTSSSSTPPTAHLQPPPPVCPDDEDDLSCVSLLPSCSIHACPFHHDEQCSVWKLQLEASLPCLSPTDLLEQCLPLSSWWAMLVLKTPPRGESLPVPNRIPQFQGVEIAVTSWLSKFLHKSTPFKSCTWHLMMMSCDCPEWCDRQHRRASSERMLQLRYDSGKFTEW